MNCSATHGSGRPLFFSDDKIGPRLLRRYVSSPGIFSFSEEKRKVCRKLCWRQNSERLLTIPMQGTRSLNLATAVAIVLFEAVRQQR